MTAAWAVTADSKATAAHDFTMIEVFKAHLHVLL
jgi:hypothetical protein